MTTEETEHKEYTGKGVGGTALGLGIAGTALGLLAGGNNMLGGLLGGNGGSKGPDFITKEEFELNNKIMERDGEIALLKADKYTNAKLLEVYNDINDRVEKLNDRINCNKSAQDNFNMNQAVLNATQSGTINCMQGQISQLFGLTRLSIPNSSCCPGWGPVAIAPQSAVTILSS